MKKLTSLLLVLVLVVSLAAPAMALSSNMTYKREHNTIAGTNYSIELGASASRATAEVTYGKNANLSVQIAATLINASSHTYAETLNTSDFSTGLSVSTSTSAKAGTEISAAYGTFYINSTRKTLSIT